MWNLRNCVWNGFKCQISPSIVFSNLKIITEQINFKLAQDSEHAKNIVHPKTKTISLVTTISCTAGDVTLADTSNEFRGSWIPVGKENGHNDFKVVYFNHIYDYGSSFWGSQVSSKRHLIASSLVSTETTEIFSYFAKCKRCQTHIYSKN